MKALPGGLFTVVDEENCATVVKPETQQPCELDACVAEWYMTSWTQVYVLVCVCVCVCDSESVYV